jgi:hypothetical protein
MRTQQTGRKCLNEVNAGALSSRTSLPERLRVFRARPPEGEQTRSRVAESREATRLVPRTPITLPRQE